MALILARRRNKLDSATLLQLAFLGEGRGAGGDPNFSWEKCRIWGNEITTHTKTTMGIVVVVVVDLI